MKFRTGVLAILSLGNILEKAVAKQKEDAVEEKRSDTLINNRLPLMAMPTLLALVIGASALTAVADWAGWHFVWRFEAAPGIETPKKHSITSIFLSYYLPFMPTLAILLGPAKFCLLYTSPSPRDRQKSRMPSSA